MRQVKGFSCKLKLKNITLNDLIESHYFLCKNDTENKDNKMSEKKLATEIASRLRKARKTAGYNSILEFTKKHNIPKSTYNQYELGARSISIELAIKFTELFQTNLIWLITGKGCSNYSDDEIIENIPERLDENEFSSIITAKKTLPSVKYKKNKNKKEGGYDINLLSDIFSKVLACYKIKTDTSELTYILEIANGIYFDAISSSSNEKELQNVINAAISTLSRTLTLKKNLG